MIIYLYCNRPREPQRGPCNVRGHTDASLPQGTREAEGPLPGWTDAPRTDGHSPTHRLHARQSPHRGHTELAASQGLWGFTWLMVAKRDGLNHPIAQPHSAARMDRRTHRDAPPLADLQGSPRGARQADDLTGPAA